MKFNMRQLVFNSKNKLPVILQDEVTECGLACVAMISNYLGHDIDLYALRQLEETSIKGTTLLSIVNLCKRLNLRTRALRIELNDLDKVPKPAILHWNMNHFVVLKAVKKNKVVIHDPATGVRRCSFEEVSHSFTGVILEVDKEDNFEALQVKNKLSLFDLIKNISGLKLGMVILVLLSLTIEVLGLISPLFIQYVTDNTINDLNLNNLLVLATGFAILVFVQVFTEYIRSHSIIFITNHLNEQFSSNVVNHILKLPLNYFEKRHKGDIQSRFQSIEQIQRKVSTDFVNTLLDGFMIIVTLLVMSIYSRVLTLVVLMALFLYILIRYVSYYELRRQTESSLSAHAKSSSVFLETLQSMLPIKTFAKEHMRFNAWRNSYINALNADIKISRVNVIYETLNKLLFNLEQIIVLCLGAGLILNNKFSIGMLVAYLAYRLQLVNKATSFIQNIFDYKLISVHLARLSDILFQKPEIVKSGCYKKMI